MRYAIRSLLKAPEFTVVAIAIIAIGIGANTAVFSLVSALLLRPLPFRDASRLFMLSGVNTTRAINGAAFSYPAFEEISARSTLLDGVAAITADQFNETGIDRPVQLRGARVSARFFDLLGVSMSVGRTFAAADDAPGSPKVVVVGRRYWASRFNDSASAVGATLILNGAPHTVVGVLGIDLPPPFDDVDVWATHVEELSGFSRAQIDAGLGYLSAVARLPPGASVEKAQAQIDAIVHSYAGANPTNTDADPDVRMTLVPIRDQTDASVRAPILVLMGAVGLVLLVACANVANLLLVRAGARSHEAAVRMALGATRGDLTRWLCNESLVLAFLGGSAGVLLAFWTVDLAASSWQALPRADVGVDGRVLLFSLAVSIAAGLVFGLVPSTLLASRSPVDALKSGARGVTPPPRLAGRVLVVAEVALSLVLLVGAGLLLHSLTRLTRTRVGFNADGLLTLRLSLPTARYNDAASMRLFMTRLMPRLAGAPGVSQAAASMALPPAITTMAPYIAADQPMVAIGKRPVGQWSAIAGDYFSTLGIPLVAGRAFTAADSDLSPLVVIVSRGLAARVWPNDSPLGKKLLVGRFPGFAEVVGVAGDVKNNGIAREPLPAMYTPYAQRPWPAMQFVLRATGPDPMALGGSVRAAVRAVDPDLPITRVETMDAALSDSIATERLITWLLTTFALVALLMAAAGLYGVIAYTVTRRTQEIAVRVALGADARQVVALIASEGWRLTAVGMLIGTMGALAGGRAVRSVLFDVSPADPVTYAAVLVLFASVACAALVVPARRALRVNPIIALRAD